MSESIRTNKPLVRLSVASYNVRSREDFQCDDENACSRNRNFPIKKKILGPEIMLASGSGKFVAVLA